MDDITSISSGKAARIEGARIAGVVACVPARVVANEDFVDRFGGGVAEVTKMTGISERRWVDEDTTASDLCYAAGKRLLTSLEWEPDTIDALIFISQTPDYRLPATATVLQDRLGLPAGVVAFDVNLGCSAYPYGLWLAMMMIQSGSARRVLLAVGDTSSRVIDPADRATAMLFGDAGTMTALEAAQGAGPASFILGSDGRGASNLVIPQGAFRTRAMETPNDPEKLYMDGGEIFTFTLKAVPPLVSDTLQIAGKQIADYDGFLFHQANAFMIRHLTKKSKLPPEKVPLNIDRFGNTSSATIPLLIADTLAGDLRGKALLLAMFGFGVGYSWASASLELGPLKCVEVIEA